MSPSYKTSVCAEIWKDDVQLLIYRRHLDFDDVDKCYKSQAYE